MPICRSFGDEYFSYDGAALKYAPMAVSTAIHEFLNLAIFFGLLEQAMTLLYTLPVSPIPRKDSWGEDP